MLFGSSASHEELIKERDEYKAKVSKLDKELYEVREQLSKLSTTTKTTSFLSSKIGRIEELEAELQKQKQRVEEAKHIAQDANKVKYDFLANIRHEIRTPMNSIMAFADMLVHELQNKTHLSYAHNIFSSGQKLLELIDNIIELSRLESGMFEIKEKAVDIPQLFTTIVKEEKINAYNKGLDLVLDLDEELPKSLMLDEVKVREIVSNLLKNAIKFTQTGMVEVKVVIEKYDNLKNLIDIAIIVKDTGRGIDAKNHQKIFEIFEKYDDANELEYQGIGLELAINRKMARFMSGDIKLSSRLGHGATFTFELKALEVVLASAENQIDESNIDFSVIMPEGGHIMVVDEHRESREMITNAFVGSNIEVFALEHPREAIAALKKQKFNMLFIDINILSMDSNAVSKVIASMSRVPVVSLTSMSLKEVVFVEGGANVVGHLQKPISRMELFKIALKVLNSSMKYTNNILASVNSTDEFSNITKEMAQKFLHKHAKKALPLFNKAISTNDLNTISSFVQELSLIASECKITALIDFANVLLEKIELFDIESINSMMREYKTKIKRLQNL